jgi:hypothetical protein
MRHGPSAPVPIVEQGGQVGAGAGYERCSDAAGTSPRGTGAT